LIAPPLILPCEEKSNASGLFAGQICLDDDDEHLPPGIDTKRSGDEEKKGMGPAVSKKGPQLIQSAKKKPQKVTRDVQSKASHGAADEANISWEDQLSAVGDENDFNAGHFESMADEE
jgi:hypothetical protein